MDGQLLSLGIGDHPAVIEILDMVRSVHPVERLVSAAVRMDSYAPISLDHQQSDGRGQVGGQPAFIIYGAFRYD